MEVVLAGVRGFTPPSPSQIPYPSFREMPAHNAFWQFYMCMLAKRVPFSPGGTPRAPLGSAWSHMPPAQRGWRCASGPRTAYFGLCLKMEGNCVAKNTKT